MKDSTRFDSRSFVNSRFKAQLNQRNAFHLTRSCQASHSLNEFNLVSAHPCIGIRKLKTGFAGLDRAAAHPGHQAPPHEAPCSDRRAPPTSSMAPLSCAHSSQPHGGAASYASHQAGHYVSHGGRNQSNPRAPRARFGNARPGRPPTLSLTKPCRNKPDSWPWPLVNDAKAKRHTYCHKTSAERWFATPSVKPVGNPQSSVRLRPRALTHRSLARAPKMTKSLQTTATKVLNLTPHCLRG